MKYFVIFCLMTISTSLFAQKEANNWVIAPHTKIDFHVVPPLVTLDIPPIVSASPNLATISDSDGNLLFYLTQNKIYNFKHQIIWNLPIFVPPHVSIVPHPSDLKKFFYFALVGSPKKCLSLFTIDMNLNGGDGQVILTDTTEMCGNFVIARQGNSQDYWLICFFPDKTTLHPVSASGFGVKKISDVVIPNYIGNLKITSDMTKIFVQEDDSLQIIDFDCLAGELSNLRTLFRQNNSNGIRWEISKNNKFIYLTNLEKLPLKNVVKVNQYSIDSVADEIEFMNSETNIGIDTIPSIKQIGELQLAPDNKIYMNMQEGYLWAIENPDFAAPLCYVNTKALWLMGATKTGLYLPNFFFYDSSIGYIKKCDAVSFYYSGTKATNVLWHFGDSHTSVELSPTHTYTIAGTYNVSVDITYPTSTQTITKTININPSPLKLEIKHE